MSSRLSGRLLSMTSEHRSSPSAPISTSLKTQATHPPSVRERTRTYPTAVAPPISRRSRLQRHARHRLRATLPRSQRPARAHGASRLTPNFATVPLMIGLPTGLALSNLVATVRQSDGKSFLPARESRDFRKAPEGGDR